jgi:hypothetical protein
VAKRLALILVATAALVAVAAPASAQAPIDSYCSPTGDYCTGIFREGGRIKLRISTFSFTGSYTLCVHPRRGPRECHSFKLARKAMGIYASRIDFDRQFSHTAGRYGVSWHYSGNRLGPRLHFAKH